MKGLHRAIIRPSARSLVRREARTLQRNILMVQVFSARRGLNMN